MLKVSDQAAFNDLLYKYMSRAKKKELEFTLNEQEFRELTSSNCHYCQKPPRQNNNRKHSNPKYKDKMRFKIDYIYNGVDRINSDLGYTKNNCVPCCGDCNLIKNDILSYEEMKVVIAALLEYRNK